MNCSNCKLKSKRLRRGRCDACYNYYRKNNFEKERPRYLYDKPDRCRNKVCQKPLETTRYKGFCRSCYTFMISKGSLKGKFSKGAKRACKNCHQEFYKGVKGGRCRACREYYRLRGEERPQELIEYHLANPRYCLNPNCGKRLQDHERCKKGFCEPCYWYQQRNKEDRPLTLCTRGEKVIFCECGKVATKEISVYINDQVEVIELCEECYEFES